MSALKNNAKKEDIQLLKISPMIRFKCGRSNEAKLWEHTRVHASTLHLQADICSYAASHAAETVSKCPPYHTLKVKMVLKPHTSSPLTIHILIYCRVN